MTREEKILVEVAENGAKAPSVKAMEILRKEYDKTYHWCREWDFVVLKGSDPKAQACCRCWDE